MSLPRFGVRRPVPANLVMLVMLVAGVVAAFGIRRQFFPEQEPAAVVVEAAWPGASPDQVVEGAIERIEEAVANLDDVKSVHATAAEHGGGVTIDLVDGANPNEALDDIERALDGITDLPDGVEPLQAELLEPRLPVIRVAAYGQGLTELQLREAAERMRDDLRALPGMGQVVLEGRRKRELRIDCHPEALLAHGLTLADVSAVVRGYLAEAPAGTLRTQGALMRLRLDGREELAEQVRLLPVQSGAGRKELTVGDLARVSHGFEDLRSEARFQGQPAAFMTVYRVGGQDIVSMAQQVRAWCDGRAGVPLELGWTEKVQALMGRQPLRAAAWEKGRQASPLPHGASVAPLSDLARFVEGRLSLLTRNASYGVVLVFLTLLLFLNLRAALWVGTGLAAALGGTLVIMWMTGITLNLLTMFGLIVVIGLLVDDAIVVCENIQAHHDDDHEDAEEASIRGANQVAWPVVATVMTSIVAFLPLGFIKGHIGDLLGALPMVVAVALGASLIESLLVLPSHMAHSLKRADAQAARHGVGPVKKLGQRWLDARDRWIQDKVQPAFGWVLTQATRMRWLTLAVAMAGVMSSLALVAGGRVGFVFLPNEDAETVMAMVRMPVGAPLARTSELATALEETATALPEVKSVSTVLGSSSNMDTGRSDGFSEHIAQVFLELVPVEARERSSNEVMDDLRHALASVDDQALQRVQLEAVSGGPAGADITIELLGDSAEALAGAAAELKLALWQFAGVFDVDDSTGLGQSELRLRARTDALAMGVSGDVLAREMQGLARGLEAWSYPDGSDEIEVRVRRQDDPGPAALMASWMALPGSGKLVPVREVAEMEVAGSYGSINRLDGKRLVKVTARTAEGTSATDVIASLNQPGEDGAPSTMAQILARRPGVEVDYGGKQEQMKDAFSSLPFGFMAAMLMVYVILAWLFGSYTQPLVVMSVIPFSVIGVVLGHLVLGFDITILSLIGMVALSGIVVNDSLILVTFYNERRTAGESVADAVVHAGKGRLRAIFLTTATTVCGLLPMLLETSFQARFLIPMAISIAAGLMAATFCVLVILPCLICIQEDIKAMFRVLWVGRWSARHADA